MDGDHNPIPTREELIQRARDLAPTLRERASKAAELRYLPEETIEDFHRLGFFKVVQPTAIRQEGMPRSEEYLRFVLSRAPTGWQIAELEITHWVRPD